MPGWGLEPTVKFPDVAVRGYLSSEPATYYWLNPEPAGGKELLDTPSGWGWLPLLHDASACQPTIGQDDQGLAAHCETLIGQLSNCQLTLFFSHGAGAPSRSRAQAGSGAESEPCVPKGPAKLAGLPPDPAADRWRQIDWGPRPHERKTKEVDVWTVDQSKSSSVQLTSNRTQHTFGWPLASYNCGTIPDLEGVCRRLLPARPVQA